MAAIEKSPRNPKTREKFEKEESKFTKSMVQRSTIEASKHQLQQTHNNSNSNFDCKNPNFWW